MAREEMTSELGASLQTTADLAGATWSPRPSSLAYLRRLVSLPGYYFAYYFYFYFFGYYASPGRSAGG